MYLRNRYHKSFEKWWSSRRNNLPTSLPKWMYDEIKTQCYRSWKAGRQHEKHLEATRLYKHSKIYRKD